jgi:hypothetical protein
MRMTLSIPDSVAEQFRSKIPPRKRSYVITRLIEHELEKRNNTLAAACHAANQEKSLQKELDEWQAFDDAFEE